MNRARRRQTRSRRIGDRRVWDPTSHNAFVQVQKERRQLRNAMRQFSRAVARAADSMATFGAAIATRRVVLSDQVTRGLLGLPSEHLEIGDESADLR